jgi:hypothetical protein
VEDAIALARRHGERGNEAEALRILGECATAGAAAEGATARVSLEHALALAAELEMRPLVAHCHLGLGKLYRRACKRQEAHEHLTTATTMYRQMDMRFWLEQAERETIFGTIFRRGEAGRARLTRCQALFYGFAVPRFALSATRSDRSSVAIGS